MRDLWMIRKTPKTTRRIDMAKQLIFPQVTVDELEMSLAAPGGDAPYLQSCAFAMERKTLESPTIDAPVQLAERVNPGSDTDTAIAIFEAYPNLNPLEASSRGFWTHLTHVELWDYMRERFKSVLETSDEVSRKKKIRGKWFLSDISQGGAYATPLGRALVGREIVSCSRARRR